MTRDSIKIKRSVGIFLLGCILFNYPILSLYNLDILIMGFPLLYFYMFCVWAGIILLLILLNEFFQRENIGETDNVHG